MKNFLFYCAGIIDKVNGSFFFSATCDLINPKVWQTIDFVLLFYFFKRFFVLKKLIYLYTSHILDTLFISILAMYSIHRDLRKKRSKNSENRNVS